MIVMNDDEKQSLKRHIDELHVEHRDLDVVISRLVDDPILDELQLRRLKKRKLHLKDQIAALENRLGPELRA